MGEALERHELRHPHGAVLADAAEIVAAEIDEHHVLGALLLVALELLGEPQVLVVAPAARPGAGNRVRLGAPPLHAHEHLGRRADNREPAHADEEHVGRGVHVPQRAVDRERVGRDVRLEPLGEHHLVDVARGDVLLGRADMLLEPLPRQVRPRPRAPRPRGDVVTESVRSSSFSRNAIFAHANW